MALLQLEGRGLEMVSARERRLRLVPGFLRGLNRYEPLVKQQVVGTFQRPCNEERQVDQ